METEQKFFVYVDYREDDGKPFYVGKGSENRAKDLDRNQLHTNIKNKHGMVRKIVLETCSEQEAFEKEVELIQELKTYFYLGEGGANFTFGGEGPSGYKYSEEQNIKKSEVSKKRWEDPELREKMCKSMKNAHKDPEIKKKKSEASKKMWEEHGDKRTLHREKLNSSIKKGWEDPELREKRISNLKNVAKSQWEDPEARELKIRGIKEAEKRKTPEQKIKELKKAWETRRLKKAQQNNP
jgi:hypothetical protein